MVKDNLVYNERFEVENLVWEIQGMKYYILILDVQKDAKCSI